MVGVEPTNPFGDRSLNPTAVPIRNMIKRRKTVELTTGIEPAYAFLPRRSLTSRLRQQLMLLP